MWERWLGWEFLSSVVLVVAVSGERKAALGRAQAQSCLDPFPIPAAEKRSLDAPFLSC